MTDPRSSDTNDIGRGSPPGMPRWVKVVGLVVVVAALVLAAFLLVGGGHGPAQHASADADGGIALVAAALISG